MQLMPNFVKEIETKHPGSLVLKPSQDGKWAEAYDLVLRSFGPTLQYEFATAGAAGGGLAAFALYGTAYDREVHFLSLPAQQDMAGKREWLLSRSSNLVTASRSVRAIWNLAVRYENAEALVYRLAEQRALFHLWNTPVFQKKFLPDLVTRVIELPNTDHTSVGHAIGDVPGLIEVFQRKFPGHADGLKPWEVRMPDGAAFHRRRVAMAAQRDRAERPALFEPEQLALRSVSVNNPGAGYTQETPPNGGALP